MLGMRSIKHQVLNAKMHQREAEVVAEAGKPGTVTIATNMAGRGTDIKLSKEVKDSGGLAIVGTERHDSRRVDRVAGFGAVANQVCKDGKRGVGLALQDLVPQHEWEEDGHGHRAQEIGHRREPEHDPAVCVGVDDV